MARQLLALGHRLLDHATGAADALVEAVEVVCCLFEGAWEVLLRMFGAGANQFEQAHTLVGQLAEALAAGLDLGAAGGEARSQPGGGLLEVVACFAALRGDALHLGRQLGHPRGQRVAALGQARKMGQLIQLAFADVLIERGEAGLERFERDLLALIGLIAALRDPLLESLGALAHGVVDARGFFA